MSDDRGSSPWIRLVAPDIKRPSLDDNSADADRLSRAVKKVIKDKRVHIPYTLLAGLPRLLRENDYDVLAALYFGENGWNLIDIYPPGKHRIYGIAVDLGTSTVVLGLIDLVTSKVIEESTFTNPQIHIGPDILTRIHYAAESGGLKRLQRLLVEGLNEEISRVAGRHGIEVSSIVGISAAGNTTMTHFFLGLDPYWICREPYIPAVNTPEILRAEEIGLNVNRCAPVLISPNVGSYLGGDLMAGIIASGMREQDRVSFLVDVGTNAEVIVGNNEWLMGCAGAAGPALEGGVASMGMMAGPGVIDRVSYDRDSGRFDISTINGGKPIGICGSGLLDLVAQMFVYGMIDLRGKFVVKNCGKRLMNSGGMDRFMLVPADISGTGRPLTLSQPDIDSLMRSKAAMYTILTTVSNIIGIPLGDIDRFYVAGTFGSYIDPRSAITLGMIPDLPVDSYVVLGNSSLKGAIKALVSLDARQELVRIREQLTYIELNVNQEFMNLFSAAKFIPHTDRSLFPSVR